jgi:hypothetical protein
MKKVNRELFYLRTYTLLSTIAIVASFYYTFQQSKDNSFECIDVERINIVEKNGDLKLVISNSDRQHSGVINGRALPDRVRPAGMIFFNSKGDECGGLIYDAMDQEAGLILSVDQFREDQIMQLQYYENPELKKRKYGLQLWDYPKENAFLERTDRLIEYSKLDNEELRHAAIQQMQADSLFSQERLFVGKRLNNEVGLFINDDEGRPRIKIYIDENNEAKMLFFDEDGKSLTPKVGQVNN